MPKAAAVCCRFWYMGSCFMEKEFEKLLSLLPECRCSITALCRGAEYFSVSAGDVESAARELPQNHDLR